MEGGVKLQDFFYPMRSVSASGPAGADIAWQFFQDNFERLQAKLDGASPSLMDAVIVCCCKGKLTTDRADEVDAFFAAHPLPLSSRTIKQTVEDMRLQASFAQNVAAAARAFFAGTGGKLE